MQAFKSIACIPFRLVSPVRHFSNTMWMPTIRDEDNFMFMAKQIVPALCQTKHKGQAGRIAVIGGSFEYTGAPYFSAISALKVGADLVHVFCSKDSSTVIKSYSPELIVHPLLDASDGVNQISKWLERFHVVVIGPGLGRDESTINVVTELISKCRELSKPLVIDADGLFIVSSNPDIIKNYPLAILTPNAVEFKRIFHADSTDMLKTIKVLKTFGNNIIVVQKGPNDSIFDLENFVCCSATGSGRRCGGQGDLLSGSLGTFLAWSLQQQPSETSDLNIKAMIACYAACRLTRECNAKAFASFGRAMTCSDMISQIHAGFQELFEL